MIPLITLLLVVTISILITRIAAIALVHTGLSRESAAFQARSAFTGVGFTTSESEHVVNHPVRRRILMLLMIVGNAGMVTVISSMILTFLNIADQKTSLLPELLMLVGGVTLLWMAAKSKWLDRYLFTLVSHALQRFTHLEIRDYTSLLHLSGDYRVTELLVEPQDWVDGQLLSEGRLSREGVLVLGIRKADGKYLGSPRADTIIAAGDTLILYGRMSCMDALDQRKKGYQGDREHEQAVMEQERMEEIEETHGAEAAG